MLNLKGLFQTKLNCVDVTILSKDLMFCFEYKFVSCSLTDLFPNSMCFE